MRTIKFRGRDMNGHFVYGLLTKKKIRSSGEIRWAIATGNCTAGETVPINENSIAQLVGVDSAGNEIYEGDLLETHGGELVADMSLCAAIKLYRLKETKS